MKKHILMITSACLSFFAINATAGINSVNGPYIGGQIGVFHTKPVDDASYSSSFELWGVTTYISPYIGYHINDYFALEGSYTPMINNNHSGDQTLGPDHYKEYTYDIAAKAIYPWENGYSVFLKLGAAYIHQDVFNQVFVGDPPIIDKQASHVVPLLGIGVSYNHTQHFATDLSIKYLAGSGPIHNIKFFGFGISYTVG